MILYLIIYIYTFFKFMYYFSMLNGWFICLCFTEWMIVILAYEISDLIFWKTKPKYSMHTGEKPHHDFWVAHSGFCFYVLSTVAIVCYVCDRGDWNFTLHFCRVVSNINVDFIYLRIIKASSSQPIRAYLFSSGLCFLLYALNVFKWFP